MPLGARTCLLVWHALSSCGLHRGKINSYRDEHFGLLYDWQPHLVEGSTVSGLFSRDNARVQAQLTAEQGGTRLDFYAVHPKGGIDFGAARHFVQRLLPRLEAFLHEAPIDWEERETCKDTGAPIASPTDFSSRVPYRPPELGVMVPISRGHLSAKEWMIVLARIFAVGLAVFFGSYFHAMGVVCLLFTGWIAWDGHKTKKVDWVSLSLFAALGVQQSWQMVLSWF